MKKIIITICIIFIVFLLVFKFFDQSTAILNNLVEDNIEKVEPYLEKTGLTSEEFLALFEELLFELDPKEKLDLYNSKDEIIRAYNDNKEEAQELFDELKNNKDLLISYLKDPQLLIEKLYE